MSPRSRSRSVTPRRSYSRSPDRRTGRRKSYSRRHDSRSSSSPRRPPSPPPMPVGRHSGKYSNNSRSASRSISPPPSRHSRRTSSRRHYSRSRSKSTSRQYDKNNRYDREKALPCRCIGVFGLNINTTQLHIREIFEKYGNIERIQVITDAQTGLSRGFCFIYYDKVADARDARDNCCGMEIDGRRIRVAYSITERPHTPTPGVYMGRPIRSTRERERERYRAPQRNFSPEPYNNKNRYERSRYERQRYERSRSRSPRRYRY